MSADRSGPFDAAGVAYKMQRKTRARGGQRKASGDKWPRDLDQINTTARDCVTCTEMTVPEEWMPFHVSETPKLPNPAHKPSIGAQMLDSTEGGPGHHINH